ncbi:MAG: DUF4982 domain-containing protein, partial [Chitinophagaceae bacterium]
HWNLENLLNNTNGEVDVWINSNADSVELYLNKKSLGIKSMPKNSHLKWKVQYQPGTLEAIGYKQGRIIKSKVETTGAATQIGLTANKSKAVANGTDIVVINVAAKDTEGRIVPTANNLINFEIAGDAKIIGVGNGDPSCHEADVCLDNNWKRSLFNGYCQVIVQVGKTKGIFKLKASSGNLKNASVDVVAF